MPVKRNYTRTTWVNDETRLNAENMNKIEQGIAQNAADKQNRLIPGNNIIIKPDNTIETSALNKAEVLDLITKKISGVYTYQGSVQSEADLKELELSGKLVPGYVYNVIDSNMNYAWTGTEWDPLGGIIDLNNYFTKDEIRGLLESKQNNLIGTQIEGQNIKMIGDESILGSGKVSFKTINNEPITGTGNISISGGGSIQIDDHLDLKSTNAIQNKIVTEAIVNLRNDVSGKQDELSATQLNNLDYLEYYYNDVDALKTDKQDKLIAGTGISIADDGKTISATGGGSYTLPAATADTLGGIKVGTGLSVTSDGTLSATAISSDVDKKYVDDELKKKQDQIDTLNTSKQDNLTKEQLENIDKIPTQQTAISNLETNKQNKLIAGENITIDPDTNIISAVGGGGSGGSVTALELATLMEGTSDVTVALNETSSKVKVALNDNYKNSKQDKIDGEHKLDYSLIANTPTNVSEFNNDADYATKEYVDNSKGGSSAKIYQVTSLDTISDMSQGDIAIVSSIIGENEKAKKLSTYIYDANLKEWVAADGSYDAETVYFNDNLVTTSAIGNISLVNGKATIESKGKNLKEVFNSIFLKEKPPVVTLPHVSTITSSLDIKNAYEIGEKVLLNYSVTINTGNYSYGPATGVTVGENDYIVEFVGQTSNTSAGAFTEYQVEKEGMIAKLNVSFKYSDGAIPNTNVGTPYAQGQIKAGTSKVKSTTLELKGYRNSFYYVGTDHTSLIDSAFIRTYAKGKGENTKDFGTVTIPEGSTRVFFAVPGDATLTKLIDTEGMGLDNKDKFRKITVDVEGANGYTAIPYSVFVRENEYGIAATEYIPTIE